MKRVTFLLLVLFATLLASCNKYSDHEMKTPLPPEPRQHN